MTRLFRNTGPGARRRSAPVAAFVGLALAATALSACQSHDVVTGSIPTDGYRTRYPIVLAEGAETLDIPVGFGTAGLSDSTRDNVRAFAADASENGTSGLVIQTPAGSGNVAAAAAVARQAKQEALRAGLSPKLVEIRSYPVADAAAAAPVRLSYSRIKAVSPPCGQWTEDMMPDPGVDDTVEFGCSTQANLAAMVANPEDLITPRAQTGGYGARRTFVVDRWIDSGTTSTGEELTDAATTTGGN